MPRKILEFNRDHGILFFRITSDIVPFASHPVIDLPWQDRFRAQIGEIGRLIRDSGMRISMHPDQFILINAPDETIVERSIAELRYHAEVLDLMDLDTTAKIQIHVGGVFGDREASIRRFIDRARAGWAGPSCGGWPSRTMTSDFPSLTASSSMMGPASLSSSMSSTIS
ncbi:MAG: hypothetical protein LUQ32_08035 [Methanomicrobiales archaeon]|nr:hypothetical protein [Methanomicrobiales archaeon]